MVKIIRTLIAGAAALAVAEGVKAGCAVDGAKAVDQLANTAIFSWAASKRCGNPAQSQVKCEVDITSAIKSAVDLSTVIVEAVNDCDDVGNTGNHKCGIAAAEVTSASAGLAAAAGGITAACPNSLNQPASHSPLGEVGLGHTTTFGHCVVDAKSSVSSLFNAMKKLSNVKKNCDEAGDECNHNSLNVVSALADLGSYLAASVNDCSSYNGAGNKQADCASHVLSLVSNLHGLADAGVNMARECHTEESRLYLEDSREHVASGSSSTFALAAALPISAVLSFVAGSRFAKFRRQSPQRDFEAQALVEMSEQ